MLLKATAGVRGTVYDLETGRRVPKVIDLELERGYLKAYFVVWQDDESPEKEIIRRDANGNYEWYEAHGRFRFVPLPVAPAERPGLLGAFNCALCGSPLVLTGDDLCPRCRAAERGQRDRFLVERLSTPLFDCKCLECSRTAVWAVADEVTVSPENGERYLYDRGMTVGRRYYCDSHYKPARLLDPRGEVIHDLRYAGPDTLTRSNNGDH